jgi:2-polyprenyl-3-methyl-5-hydroxy-6-metoxy-1,4-benzoquinol methylase
MSMFKLLLNVLPARYKNLHSITMDLVNSIFLKEFDKHSNIINEILQTENPFTNLTHEERCLPGETRFIQSGYYQTMFKRYLFIGAFFCKNKKVLDSCAGLGWGACTLSQYAKSVAAFDIDNEAVDFCISTWKKNNIHWLKGDALDISFLGNEHFDVITGMETIEHFTYIKAVTYIENMKNILKKNGIFVGTSSFPLDRKTADEVCSKNPSHKYIFTFPEMNELLDSLFSEHIIVDNWMFIARR